MIFGEGDLGAVRTDIVFQENALRRRGEGISQTEELFLEKADPWLIAKAMVTGAVVVTHESLVSDNTKKVKVPNICKQFGVSCINTFDFLRGTKAKFGLI